MRWLSRAWRKHRVTDSEKMVAQQAVTDSVQVKEEAERRWADVKKITDEFTVAVERAMRGHR